MVAPVCVQYAEFSLVRVAAFFREVFHHLTKVIGIHCQSHLAAERLQVLFLHIDKTLDHRHRLYRSMLGIIEFAEVFLTGLHSIDIVMLDFGDGLLIDISAQDNELGTLDMDVGFRVNEVHAVHCRSRSLVELSREIFHCDVFGSCQVTFI